MSAPVGDTQCPPIAFTPARGAAQETAHTASRHTGPRRWLRSTRWLIDAGLHPKTNTTTLRVAEDLAARMDYDTGHARYCLDEMVARLGIARPTIKRHISYLRELGALAWVQHGTRTNIRRLMGLKGYAATATVYAAVIPPVYDHAMGHRIIGTGYEARIVIDQRGQTPHPPKPVDTPGNEPVENPGPEDREPPSLTWLREERKVKVVGGSNYTSQTRQANNPIPHQSSNIDGRRRTAADVRKAAQTVRLVRALVNWTQSVPLRRLEYVLRPWTDQGWDATRIADELHGICSGLRWKPKRPDAFIRAHIAKAIAHEEDLAQAVAWEDSTAYRDLQSLQALFGAPAQPEPDPERTDEDRLRARMDWNNWPQVLDHFEEDELDAVDLYGKKLVNFAIEQGARFRRQEVRA